MANVISDSFKDYFESLSATSEIVDHVTGSTFTLNTNLFVYKEQNVSECLTIIPYPGGPPNSNGDRMNSAVQLRYKSPNVHNADKTMQSIINKLHNNKKIFAGRIESKQSNPISFPDVREGGEQVIVIADFEIKHVKL